MNTNIRWTNVSRRIDDIGATASNDVPTLHALPEYVRPEQQVAVAQSKNDLALDSPYLMVKLSLA